MRDRESEVLLSARKCISFLVSSVNISLFSLGPSALVLLLVRPAFPSQASAARLGLGSKSPPHPVRHSRLARRLPKNAGGEEAAHRGFTRSGALF